MSCCGASSYGSLPNNCMKIRRRDGDNCGGPLMCPGDQVCCGLYARMMDPCSKMLDRNLLRNVYGQLDSCCPPACCPLPQIPCGPPSPCPPLSCDGPPCCAPPPRCCGPRPRPVSCCTPPRCPRRCCPAPCGPTPSTACPPPPCPPCCEPRKPVVVSFKCPTIQGPMPPPVLENVGGCCVPRGSRC